MKKEVDTSSKEPTASLSQEERQVLDIMRHIGYGKLLITLKNGVPVHAEVQKSFPIEGD